MHDRFIDISYQMTPEMAIYPGNPGFTAERSSDIEKGGKANVSCITMGSHTGTHMDAPLHFISGGESIDQLPLDRMNGRAIVADVTGHSEISREMLEKLPIGKGDIVLFRTDNSLSWNCDRILDDHVTLTYDAADYLAEKGIKMAGIDYLTIERPRSRRTPGKSVHLSLLKNGVLIVEGLALKDVNEGVYEFFCMPLAIKGLDGCPVRCALKKID